MEPRLAQGRNGATAGSGTAAGLREALGDVLDGLSPREAEFLLRGVLLLTAPTSMRYWQDYLGITVDEAVATASYLIGQLAERRPSRR